MRMNEPRSSSSLLVRYSFRVYDISHVFIFVRNSFIAENFQKAEELGESNARLAEIMVLHSQFFEQIKILRNKVNTIVSGLNEETANAITTSVSNHSVHQSPSTDFSGFYDFYMVKDRDGYAFSIYLTLRSASCVPIFLPTALKNSAVSEYF